MAIDWNAMAGAATGGLFGYLGAKQQNVASAAQAQKQMDFQERMSSTAHQRQMADMRKAGLNPILSAKYGGASSPSGAQAPMVNKYAVALQNATTAANVENIRAQTQKTQMDTRFVQQNIARKDPWEKVAGVAGESFQKFEGFTKNAWNKFIDYGKENPPSDEWRYLMEQGIVNILNDQGKLDKFINFIISKEIVPEGY